MEEAEEFAFADSGAPAPGRAEWDEDGPDPALIYVAPGHDGPGTHVLIIGISHYTYLNGGTRPRPDIADGMGQLDAPAPSAIALARWFLDEFDNPRKPLASLALVVSEEHPATFTHAKAPGSLPLPCGDFSDVRSAVGRWVERAEGDRENQVIFFFAGHGVATADPLLLLRDFGESRQSRFDGALRLHGLIRAMKTRIPEYQLFLIDACRVPAVTANSTLGTLPQGRNALDERPLADRGGKPAKQSISYAASELTAAYGRTRNGKGALSLYAEALLKALRGGGAQSNAQWWVTTLGLQTALVDYTTRLSAIELVNQQAEGGGAQFSVSKPADIKVPVYLTTVPTDGLQRAQRVEARLKGAVAEFYDPATHGKLTVWACVLTHSDHELVVTFSQGSDYNDYHDVLKLSPPSAPYEVPLRRR
jgi:hypothetical protein